MKRIYHHYMDWEEIDYNMWGNSEDKKADIQKCFDFMNDTALFERFMIKVSIKWKYSCENALTDTSQNRVAWLGQAACAYGINVPCDITKKAWSLLGTDKQDDSNLRASRIIKKWEQAHENNEQISFF